jgi:hypothetical protein
LYLGVTFAPDNIYTADNDNGTGSNNFGTHDFAFIFPLGFNTTLVDAIDNPGTWVAAVPEPSTWAMLLLGFAGIAFVEES